MLSDFKSFYIIGIGGISMSAIAKILKKENFIIYGSDIVNSEIIENLKKENIEVVIGQAPEFVEKCDAVIVTGAISDDNSDVLLAKSKNKPIFNRAEILGEITKKYKLISVAGSHGKTTTTGMIASILLYAGIDPTIHIGGILNNIESNLYIGKSDVFLTEACEYKDSFLSLKNDISIVLNIQEDHLDYFQTLDNIFKSFNKYIQNTSKNGVIIYNYDDFDSRLIIPENSISFGLKEGAIVQARNIEEYQPGKYSFDLYFKEIKLENIKLPCFGRHNIYNALASCACALFMGIEIDKIKDGLFKFSGIKRRNELIYDVDGHLIIHDYAHHPTEIEASIKALKEITKSGKLVVIFQPHTFTRTQSLFEQFVKAFDECDEVWLLPIYPAREKSIEGITSLILSEKICENGKKSRYFDSFELCSQEILNNIDKVDVFAILGAGDIEKLAYSLKDIDKKL